MAEAFKCDSCGDYADGTPTVITFIPAKMTEKTLKYDLCPFCANEVIEVICKEKIIDNNT